MPNWRCPHCGTPQTETARCWVCGRSSTACATCRNVRASIAGSILYCALDRRRTPLAGDEIRSCWEPDSASSVREEAPEPAATPAPSGGLAWVELTPTGSEADASGAPAPTAEQPSGGPSLNPEAGFWADLAS